MLAPSLIRPLNLPPLRPRPKEPPATGALRVIAVASGKGGVGKTNFVVNVGLALAREGQRVLILDADLGLANVDVLLGINPRYRLQHVLAGRKSLAEIVVEGPGGLKVIPGGSGIAQLAELPGEARRQFLAEAASLEEASDFLLIDTAPGISRGVCEFLAAAGEAIIITTTEPTALTDAYALIKVLTLEGISTPLKLVVNAATSHQEAKEASGKLAKVVREFLGTSLEDLGYLPHDPAVAQAVREQRPVLLAYPHAPISGKVGLLSRELLRGRGTRPEEGRKGFFQRMAQTE